MSLTPRLRTLIARARECRMTAAEEREQRISFAYGNTAIDCPRVTREDVVRAAKALDEARA